MPDGTHVVIKPPGKLRAVAEGLSPSWNGKRLLRTSGQTVRPEEPPFFWRRLEGKKRVSEHENGEPNGYTSTRRPVRVVFTQEFSSREEAVAAELKIKGWSRKKKEALNPW